MDGRIIDSPQAYSASLGTAVWMMDDCRARTIEALDGLPEADVDVIPPGFDNSIGSLLYHIAAIEADWIYVEVLERDYPDWMAPLFPHDVREDGGRLSVVDDQPLREHLGRLAEVRRRSWHDVRDLSESEFHRARDIPPSPVSPAWVFHHLLQHEAEHRGQIQALRRALMD